MLYQDLTWSYLYANTTKRSSRVGGMAEMTQPKPGDVSLESELEATAKDSDRQSEIKPDDSNPSQSANSDSEMPLI